MHTARRDAPPAESVVDRIYEAMDREFDAIGALDAGGGAAQTTPLLDAAATRLAEARDSLTALMNAPAKRTRTGPKAAPTQVAKAISALAKVQRGIAKSKSRLAVDKLFKKVFAAQSKAIAAIEQQP